MSSKEFFALDTYLFFLDRLILVFQGFGQGRNRSLPNIALPQSSYFFTLLSPDTCSRTRTPGNTRRPTSQPPNLSEWNSPGPSYSLSFL